MSNPSSPEPHLVAAARAGDVEALDALLDQFPGLLALRAEPHGWSLLHFAAQGGHLPAVDLLIRRGADVDAREQGDNTTAMHWAAAAGALDVVRRLADAGGDVVGAGDDHALEVIGWATCWDECNDDAHRAVANFLVSRGAEHHVFSAVALGLGQELRRMAAEDPSALHRRQSRNETNRTPLQFAVARNRPDMVALLLELGADPLAVDGDGQPIAAYATNPETDRPAMEAIRAMTAAELDSAARGGRAARGGPTDLVALLALDDWELAERLLKDNPTLTETSRGVLHLLAKRNALDGAAWLLGKGADPNGLWRLWDMDVTPLHLAVWHRHVEVVDLLLRSGADPAITDSKFGSDALGWARHFQHEELVALLTAIES